MQTVGLKQFNDVQLLVEKLTKDNQNISKEYKQLCLQQMQLNAERSNFELIVNNLTKQLGIQNTENLKQKQIHKFEVDQVMKELLEIQASVQEREVSREERENQYESNLTLKETLIK